MNVDRNSKGQFIKGGAQDLTGQKFGRLEAVRLSEKRSGRKTYWECKCECGNPKTIRTDSLKNGLIRSCGCLKKEQDEKNLDHKRWTHRESGDRLYSVWNGMHRRCYNPQDSKYGSYGGRGINVCDDWHDVKKFKDWALNNGYQEDLSIERIDVNGNYEPTNCTWIPISEQAWNKRNTILIKHQGETKCLSEWCKLLELSEGTIRSRYERGETPPKLFRPVGSEHAQRVMIEYQGETLYLKEWCEKLGLTQHYKAVCERHRRGIKPPELFAPIQKKNTTMVEYQGESLSLSEWCNRLNLPYEPIGKRFRRGKRPPELFEPIKKKTPR